MALRDGEKSECLHCGSHVSKDFRRVYGDQENRAHRCLACDTIERLSSGSAAGIAVNNLTTSRDSSKRHSSLADAGGDSA
jgi:hypothetical protein